MLGALIAEVHMLVLKLCDSTIADWLSCPIAMGSITSPAQISPVSLRSEIPSRTASEMEIFAALQEETATRFCFFELQTTVISPNVECKTRNRLPRDGVCGPVCIYPYDRRWMTLVVENKLTSMPHACLRHGKASDCEKGKEKQPNGLAS